MRLHERGVADWLPKKAAEPLFARGHQRVGSSTTIENTENDHGIVCYLKRDRGTALEAGRSHSRSDVVAAGASLRQRAKTLAPRLDALDVSERAPSPS